MTKNIERISLLIAAIVGLVGLVLDIVWQGTHTYDLIEVAFVLVITQLPYLLFYITSKICKVAVKETYQLYLSVAIALLMLFFTVVQYSRIMVFVVGGPPPDFWLLSGTAGVLALGSQTLLVSGVMMGQLALGMRRRITSASTRPQPRSL